MTADARALELTWVASAAARVKNEDAALLGLDAKDELAEDTYTRRVRVPYP